MKVFFDTNILVYLFDAGSPAKQRRARDLLAQHTRAGEQHGQQFGGVTGENPPR